MIQKEVDRMSRLPKKSDLPKSKLSPTDAYLFKLSSQAAKKQECMRRRLQREKAYAKRLGCIQHVHIIRRPGVALRMR